MISSGQLSVIRGYVFSEFSYLNQLMGLKCEAFDVAFPQAPLLGHKRAPLFSCLLKGCLTTEN
jgi:hypothetical protein